MPVIVAVSQLYAVERISKQQCLHQSVSSRIQLVMCVFVCVQTWWSSDNAGDCAWHHHVVGGKRVRCQQRRRPWRRRGHCACECHHGSASSTAAFRFFFFCSRNIRPNLFAGELNWNELIDFSCRKFSCDVVLSVLSQCRFWLTLYWCLRANVKGEMPLPSAVPLWMEKGWSQRVIFPAWSQRFELPSVLWCYDAKGIRPIKTV